MCFSCGKHTAMYIIKASLSLDTGRGGVRRKEAVFFPLPIISPPTHVTTFTPQGLIDTDNESCPVQKGSCAPSFTPCPHNVPCMGLWQGSLQHDLLVTPPMRGRECAPLPHVGIRHVLPSQQDRNSCPKAIKGCLNICSVTENENLNV